jgi:hypothetical protein
MFLVDHALLAPSPLAGPQLVQEHHQYQYQRQQSASHHLGPIRPTLHSSISRHSTSSRSTTNITSSSFSTTLARLLLPAPREARSCKLMACAAPQTSLLPPPSSWEIKHQPGRCRRLLPATLLPLLCPLRRRLVLATLGRFECRRAPQREHVSVEAKLSRGTQGGRLFFWASKVQ